MRFGDALPCCCVLSCRPGAFGWINCVGFEGWFPAQIVEDAADLIGKDPVVAQLWKDHVSVQTSDRFVLVRYFDSVEEPC